jgi:hypothetical protein
VVKLTGRHLGAGGRVWRAATRTRTLALVAAAVAVAIAPVAQASSASATEYNINTWENGGVCSSYGYSYVCLWYHPNLTGALWGTQNSFVDLDTASPTPKFNNTNYGGSSGLGQPVANDAASMADATTFCTADTYVYGNGTGDYDHLSPGWSGNLTAGLRNNEGSIAYYC